MLQIHQVLSVPKSQICETTAGFATERHYLRTGGPNSIITSKQVCVPSSSFATCGPWTILNELFSRIESFGSDNSVAMLCNFPPTYSLTMSSCTLLLATYLEMLVWIRETWIFKKNSEAPVARTMSMIIASLVLDGTRCCKAVV